MESKVYANFSGDIRLYEQESPIKNVRVIENNKTELKFLYQEANYPIGSCI